MELKVYHLINFIFTGKFLHQSVCHPTSVCFRCVRNVNSKEN